MKPNRKNSFIMVMSLTAVLVLTAAWPRSAAAAGPTECGLIGTWYGNSGSAATWLGVNTAGSSLSKGEMLLDWVRVRDYLLTVDNVYPTVTSLSDGRGVWEQTAKGKYKYTWYAYGIGSAFDPPVYSVRVSGLAANTDCDHIAIDFTYEIFDGFVLPENMSEATPVGGIVDTAQETRVPLTVVVAP